MKKAILFTVTFIFLLMSGIALADTLHFTWDANIDQDLVGYRLYRSYTSGDYIYGSGNYVSEIICGPGDTTCVFATDTVSEYNTTYYWVLTAFDSEGLESGPSNELSYTVGAPPWAGVPPANPGGVIIDQVIP